MMTELLWIWASGALILLTIAAAEGSDRPITAVLILCGLWPLWATLVGLWATVVAASE